jgi:hypothetical protein
MNEEKITAVLKSLNRAAPQDGFEDKVLQKIQNLPYVYEPFNAFIKTALTALIAASFLFCAAAVFDFFTPSACKYDNIAAMDKYVLGNTFADKRVSDSILG